MAPSPPAASRAGRGTRAIRALPLPAATTYCCRAPSRWSTRTWVELLARLRGHHDIVSTPTTSAGESGPRAAPGSTARCGCGTRPAARALGPPDPPRRPADRRRASIRPARESPSRLRPAPLTSSTYTVTDASHACASTPATPRSRACKRRHTATCSPAARTAACESSRRVTCDRSAPRSPPPQRLRVQR